MKYETLETEEQYQAALSCIDKLFGVEPQTPEADELELLVSMVEKYEAENYPLPAPSTKDVIQYNLEHKFKGKTQ
jgi:HTH-type transcriptional regulator/antitoxin HigA